MTQEQDIFLKLLKVGLGGSLDSELPELSESQVNKLYEISCEQTVRGLVFNGLTSVNVQRRGGVETILNWYAAVKQIERANKHINSILGEVIEFIPNIFHPVMIKGAVVAQEYDNPLIRESGDIDLYFSTTEGFAAVENARTWTSLQNDMIRDVSFKYKDVNVEIHPYLVHSSNPKYGKYNRRFQEWCDIDILENRRVIEIDGNRIPVASVMLNILFVFYHLWVHFVRGGIGLRQICDWRMTLHNNYGKYDIEELRDKLEHFGLMRPWITFGGILVEYLGLPVKEMPFYTKTGKTERLLEIIFKEGNFGHKNTQKTMPTEKSLQVLRKGWDVVNRYRKVCGVFPIDSIHFLPGISSLRRYI